MVFNLDDSEVRNLVPRLREKVEQGVFLEVVYLLGFAEQ